MNKSQSRVSFKILNELQVRKMFKDLRMSSAADREDLKRIVKAPIDKIAKKSMINLTLQKSVKTGSLLSSFRTRAFTRWPKVSAVFESNSKYNFALDFGTKDRYTKAGKWIGAVGHATTNYKGRNYSFRLGFAQRAITKVAPTIIKDLTRGLQVLSYKIMRRSGI